MLIYSLVNQLLSKQDCVKLTACPDLFTIMVGLAQIRNFKLWIIVRFPKLYFENKKVVNILTQYEYHNITLHNIKPKMSRKVCDTRLYCGEMRPLAVWLGCV